MAAAPVLRRSELGEALRACRSAFIGVGIMSCMINLLYLTGSVFMLEVYDRVLPSRSVPTTMTTLKSKEKLVKGPSKCRRSMRTSKPKRAPSRRTR